MLLFNCYPVYCLIVDVHFNISYVIIQLPLVALCTHFQSKISIRHMLLFNPLSIGISDSLFPFQYISYYYSTGRFFNYFISFFISIHHMLLFNLFMPLFTLVCPHFNTFHVVIQL